MKLPPMGHNNPPDPIDEAIAPFSDYIAEAQNWLDGHDIENEAQLKATDALLKQIKAAAKSVSTARDAATKPLHEAWQAEIKRWKPTQDDLDMIAKGLVAIQDPFKRKMAAEKEAARRAAFEAAEKARRDAEEAARAASVGDINAQREAEAAKIAAMEAQKAASAAKKDTVKGMRTVHKYEIDDHRAALNWIAQNDRDAVTAFIEAYVSKNHRDKAISGVRTWTEKEAF